MAQRGTDVLSGWMKEVSPKVAYSQDFKRNGGGRKRGKKLKRK